MTRRLHRLWQRAQKQPKGWSAVEIDDLARLLGFVEQKKRGKGDHRLYFHPKGLVWGFDPRGDVKVPYVKELIRLALRNGLVESDEKEQTDDTD